MDWKHVSIAIFLVAAASAHANDLQLLSVPSPSIHAPAGGGGDSVLPSTSADGNLVLFASTANNLALRPQDNHPFYAPRPLKFNVFLRNRSEATTALVSVTPDGMSQGDERSTPRALSTNGQFVLFESSASNLIAGKTNSANFTAVFVRDLHVGTTTLVSISTNGSFLNADCMDSVMTPDGRYVAFASKANNLVPGDTNGLTDVFLRDLVTGTTTLVSTGAQAATPFLFFTVSSSDAPEISPDGRYVAFLSTATNFVAGVTNLGEVYVRDMVTGNIIDASLNARTLADGVLAFGSPRFTADGQTLAFYAWQMPPATNVVTTNSFIFLHHLQGNFDDLVTSNAVAPQSELYKYAQSWDMTPDGRFVAYVGTNTDAGEQTTGVFVWDSQSQATTLVSPTTSGTHATNSTCDMPVIDPLARYVVFSSTATNLTTNAVSSDPHLYFRDLAGATTKLIDQGTNGTGSEKELSSPAALSDSGRFVVFDSSDADLIPDDNNQGTDVFLRDMLNDTTELISVRASALSSQTINPLLNPHGVSMSSDGRYAAFWGFGAGLIEGYSNKYPNIFVRDMVTGSNQVVDVDTNGLPSTNTWLWHEPPTISADGRYVVFSSSASTLVPNDTNNASDVFVRDLQTSTTSLISVNGSGTGSGNDYSAIYGQGSVWLGSPGISTDGRFVAFASVATNLVSRPAIYGENVFVRDRATSTTYMLTTNGVWNWAVMTPDGHYVVFSPSSTGSFPFPRYTWDSQAAKIIRTNRVYQYSSSLSANGQWFVIATNSPTGMALFDSINNVVKPVTGLSFNVLETSLSLDGRCLAYSARSPTGFTNSSYQIFLYDSLTASNRLVSQNLSLGFPANSCSHPGISADGRYIVYESMAPDIVPFDNNGTRDVFLFDQQTGTTSLLSASADHPGSANYASIDPNFVGDGQTIAFESAASDLVENDFNQAIDLFSIRISSTNSASAPIGQIFFIPGAPQKPIITWPASSGQSYSVQFKNELTDTAWQTLSGVITIEGSKAYIVDTSPNPTHRFYRVQPH
jgi:Tol biopolymer transport system component